MLKPTLVDTGPLVALIDRRDAYHDPCVAAFAALTPPLVTCLPAIVEAAYLLRSYPELGDQLIESASGGLLQVLPIETDDLSNAQAIRRRYRDLRLDLADACLMHLAEREQIDTVFTLDRRDFGVYRTESGDGLTLVP